MALRIKEWVQTDWRRAGRNLYREKGDLDTLDALLPHQDGRTLMRAPAWAAHVEFPTGFTRCRGAVYDWANRRYVFIGKNASDYLAACYADTSWTMSAITQLVGSDLNADGLFGQNVAWWGGYLWVVASDGKVYRGGAYTAALSAFYTSTDALALAPFGDKMYVATTGGNIVVQADADDTMDAYYLPVGELLIKYIGSDLHTPVPQVLDKCIHSMRRSSS